MKHVLMIAFAAAATVLFTACDDVAPQAPKAAPAPKAKAEAVPGKPAGVPTKVYKQIKGLEQKHNNDVQKQLDKM